MISRQELLDFAREFGLQPQVVEKDYALGWLLAAIGQHPATRDTWVFKGGTRLKKCYFETYRFSEDLDFTLRDAAHLDEAFLRAPFQKLADWVHEQTGMELPPDAHRIEVFDNGRGGRSAEGRIGYRGPIARGGDSPRIKLDLTDHEHVALPAVRRPVHHPYSDRMERHARASVAEAAAFRELLGGATRGIHVAAARPASGDSSPAVRVRCGKFGPDMAAASNGQFMGRLRYPRAS